MNQSQNGPKPRHTKQLLDRLLTDYVILRTQFPHPTRAPGRSAPRQSRTYGHPAEWASDTSRIIADLLDETNAALRDHLNWTPPPPRQRAESRVVMHAYNTLTAAIDQFTQWEYAQDSIIELQDIHNYIGRCLGQTRQRQHLPVPCPNCQHLGLIREVHLDRRDNIQCYQCAQEIKELEYGLFTRMIIDELLKKADEDAIQQQAI
jgi:hypothetical protein